MAFKRVLVDIETNNLLEPMLDFTSMPYKLKKESKLWCIVFRNLDNKEQKVSLKLTECTQKRLKELCAPVEEIAGHNIVAFDLPALQLFGVLDYSIGYPGKSSTLFGNPVKISDTWVWSQLLNPDRPGGHSLKNLSKNSEDSKTSHEDFSQYSDEMLQYCEEDTLANVSVYFDLMEEKGDWDYAVAYEQELKLVDLTLKQSTFGFKFNSELATKHLVTLDKHLDELSSKVNPLLPPKPLNKGERDSYTPPKAQIKKDLTFSANLIKFANKIGAALNAETLEMEYEGKVYKLPHVEPVREFTQASIDDLDHLKGYLLELGWDPSEWKERRLSEDSKKQKLTPEKMEATIKRYVDSTLNGPFKHGRLKILGVSAIKLEDFLFKKYESSGHFRVPVSPMIRVGTDKKLCPNLKKLGEKASFALDVTQYLTYRHRRNSIAGGGVDEDGEPNTGYMSLVREDGRVSTPAFTIGAASFRYKHSKIANIPRVTSVFGYELRSLFEADDGYYIQLGADFASLEARTMGHYVIPYTDGEILARDLIAEKPNDLHAFPVSSELLTNSGWKPISNLTTTDQVLQWDKNSNSFSFTDPSSVVIRNNNIEDLMYEFTGSFNFKMTTTSKHRILLFNPVDNKYIDVLAKDLDLKTHSKYLIPLASNLNEPALNLSDDMLKLIVATQADGCLNKDSTAITFTFVKERKINRLLSLLIANEIPHTVKKYFRKNRYETTIRLNANNITKIVRSYLTIDKEFNSILLKMSQRQKLLFLNELQYWDGTLTKYGTVIFDTTDHVSALVVHTLARLSNLNTRSYQYDRKTNFGVCNITRIVFSQYAAFVPVKSLRINTYTSKELVGCVTVPTTYLLVKQDNSIFITGNCLSSDTELLTKKGWINVSEVTLETNLAQWDKTTTHITYTYPSEVIKNKYTGKMVSVEGSRLSILMTPEHRNIVLKDDQYTDVLAKDLTTDSGVIPVAGLLFGNDIYHSHILEAIIERVSDYRYNTPSEYTNIIRRNSGILVQSENLSVIQQIQTDLCKYQIQAFIVEKKVRKSAYGPEVTVYQTILPFKVPNLKGSDLKHTLITEVDYDDYVYCVAVNTTYIVARRNGHIFITGNSINAKKLNIHRDAAKSFSYACMYGAQVEKLAKMLGIPLEEAEDLYLKYWDAVPALKELKEKIEQYWVKTGKDYLLGIDKRKLKARSKHSLINLLFQSAGAILCKYSVVYMCQELEEKGFLGDPFIHSKEDSKVFLMTVYHDELQVAVSKGILDIVRFDATDEDTITLEQQKAELSEDLDNPLLDESEISAIHKSIKNLQHPAELRALAYKQDKGLSCDIGHDDLGYYVTHENIVIDSFNKGIKRTTEQFKLKVDLGIAWNTGTSWASTH